MAKVMLVEDDNNLREIYEARLAAEGYIIVAAQDGEEALALAVKERPDLIIADIMMPKVSGFDMLDILRSTPETKNAKIIMMTALSQAEDKTRAESLGADKYLVKSQVTLEDVVKVAGEMLAESGAISAPAAAPTPATPVPSVPLPAPVTAPTTAAPVSAPSAPLAPVPAPTPTPSPTAAPASIPVATAPGAPTPITEPAEGLVEEALPAATPSVTPAPTPPATPASDAATPAADEEAAVSDQIEKFIANNPTLTTSDEPEKEKAEEKPVAPSAPSAPKTTAIPVTVADDADDKKEDDKPSDAAEQTMANALTNLGGVPAPKTEEKSASNTDDKKEDEDDGKPQLAPKRGGERVIAPISDPSDAAADLQKLLANEPHEEASTTLAANSVIAPDGKITTSAENTTPNVQSFDTAPTSDDVATPPTDGDSDPNKIAL